MPTQLPLPRVHHVGLVVRDLDEAVAPWVRGFGATVRDVPDPSNGHLRIAFVTFSNVELEVIQPVGDGHPNAAWLARHGPGVHHVAVSSDDCAADLARLVDDGFTSLDAAPKGGAGQTRVAFFDPASFAGAVVHLAQDTEESNALRAAGPTRQQPVGRPPTGPE